MPTYRRRKQSRTVFAVVGGLVVVAGAATWWFMQPQKPTAAPDANSAAAEDASYHGPAPKSASAAGTPGASGRPGTTGGSTDRSTPGRTAQPGPGATPGPTTRPAPGSTVPPTPGSATPPSPGAATPGSTPPSPGATTRPASDLTGRPPLDATERPAPGATTQPGVGATSRPAPGTATGPDAIRPAPEEVLVPANSSGSPSGSSATPGRPSSAPGGNSAAPGSTVPPPTSAALPGGMPGAAPAGASSGAPGTGSPTNSGAPAADEDPTARRARDDTRTGNRDIEAGRKLIEQGKPLEARAQLNKLLAGSLSPAEATETRSLLKRVADETVFSRNVVANDSLMDNYTIASGDNLTAIGRRYHVPYDVLMEINGIKDARSIRAGQKIKAPRGPFNVRISKSAFRLDIYLGDVYVRSYTVGLGAENGTPEGVWKVKDRIANPTYYPSASATNKRIIPPDDPTNPLGEHWIALEGVSGDAVGREGYGIHGTIEPESIGRAASLGCIRMHNEDVAFLFKLLAPGQSTVTIGP